MQKICPLLLLLLLFTTGCKSYQETSANTDIPVYEIMSSENTAYTIPSGSKVRFKRHTYPYTKVRYYKSGKWYHGFAYTNLLPIVTSSNKANSSNNYKSTGGPIHVKGHYRTSKTGKTYYVRPHSRSASSSRSSYRRR